MKIASFFIVFFISLIAEARQEVKIRSYVHYNDGVQLTLAHLLPSSVENQNLRVLFEKYSLSNAPQVGEKRILTDSLISSFIRRAKTHDGKTMSKYYFRIPGEVVVENPGSTLPESEVRQSLIEHWKKQCPSCRFDIQEISLPRFPESKKVSSWHFIGVPPIPKGSFSVGIRVRSKGKKNKNLERFWINGVVRVKKQVPVASRGLNFGERLMAKDFKIEFRDVTYARGDIPQPDLLIGRKLKMTKAAGQILWQNDLAKEKAVLRGEWVKVKSTEGALEISLMARAENDGFIGDVIRLNSGSSKQVITGVAIAKGQVELK